MAEPLTMLRGTPAARGVAHAPAHVVAPALTALPDLPPPVDPAAEEAAAHAALNAVAADMRARGMTSTPVAREVLEALAALVEDPALSAEVDRRVAAREPAAAAAWGAFETFAGMLEALGGAFAERASDLLDLRRRVAARLLGLPDGDTDLGGDGGPVVLVAEDLAPADTATLDPRHVVALVTERGGPTSHTAIVARSLGIPAVVGVRDARALTPGTPLCVDGDRGEVLLEPPAEEVARRLDGARARRDAAARVRGPGRTADDVPISLLVNAGGPGDVAELDDGCAGVGLLRTELLFLHREDAPSVEEQRDLYRAVLERLEGRTAVVRTLDAGSDKPVPFLSAAAEANPALGVRGYRIDRIAPNVLDDQLRAIALAAEGLEVELRVMGPMISTVGEADAFVRRAHGHGLGSAGVMVEVPALALCADELMEVVDFISLGTNDLSQYGLAACRTLGELADLLDPWQPGLLRLMAMALGAAREHGVPAGVCGEAAGDELLACVLVGLGATSLSTSGAALPVVRAALANHTLASCEAAAAAALQALTPADAATRAATAIRPARTPQAPAAGAMHPPTPIRSPT